MNQFPEGTPVAILTNGMTASSGEVFCDDPIAPDVETETPLEDAISWIQSTR